MDIGTDLLSMRTFMKVYVLEVMGRNAGWITAAASLANQPGSEFPLVICLPEQPFQSDSFLERVSEVQREYGCALVVASEGLRNPDGKLLTSLAQPGTVDSFGHPVPAGAGDYLAGLIRAELKLPCRSERPGTVQRAAMACVSPVDQAEAREVGKAAVRLALEGKSGCMVTLERLPGEPYRCTTGAARLKDVANRERLIPPEFMTPDGVAPAFRAYAEPLLGGPLPKYTRLQPLPVPKLCGK